MGQYNLISTKDHFLQVADHLVADHLADHLQAEVLRVSDHL